MKLIGYLIAIALFALAIMLEAAFPFLTLAGGLTNAGSQIVLIKIFRPNDSVAVDVFGLSFDPHVLLYRPGTFTEDPDL